MPNPPNAQLPYEFTPRFQEDLKRLSRKYHHLQEDLDAFLRDFVNNPLEGAFAIPSFERKLWKKRMRSTDQQKGKSGGFRLIFYLDEQNPVKAIFLTIYPKSEREDIAANELLDLFKRFLAPLITPQPGESKQTEK